MKMVSSFILLITSTLTVACSSSTDSRNSEADILSVSLAGDVLKTDPRIENNQVVLMVKQQTDLTGLAPEFVVSPGATLSPASGTVRDFTSAQTYTVTSEDRGYNKNYTVLCSASGMTQQFNFENSEIKSGYYVFYELDASGEKQYIWATGNPGYSFMGAKGADDYPTVHYPSGHTGKAVKLETLGLSGLISELSRIYMIPGNLYIGSFVAANVVLDPMKATRFGLPCEFIPTEITGYYQYAPGEEFRDEKKNVIPGKVDTFSIIAVVYETDDQTSYLDGHNLMTSSNIVAMAEMPDSDKKATSQWTRFTIPVRHVAGKTIDPQKLADGGYNLALVFTSSAEGDQYRGAVGSTLLIDDVRLIRED